MIEARKKEQEREEAARKEAEAALAEKRKIAEAKMNERIRELHKS